MVLNQSGPELLPGQSSPSVVVDPTNLHTFSHVIILIAQFQTTAGRRPGC
ncbi:hypothetical protein [Streptomyces sp. AM 2-1-1]|nr:hypothetical protein [Streptomyces sp. AM 2-1-1]WEH38035.1 hypothetical protein PZB77_00030 [Streptomyces sp. AM 2-1-1]